jgi:hypothetical protein
MSTGLPARSVIVIAGLILDKMQRFESILGTHAEEGNCVAGKMRFHGIHWKELFGVPPSVRHVWWIGMPIFTFEEARVRDLFVLGDITSRGPRLNRAPTSWTDFALRSVTGVYYIDPFHACRAVEFAALQDVRRQAREDLGGAGNILTGDGVHTSKRVGRTRDRSGRNVSESKT